MLSGWVVLLVSIAYLAVLFAIAYVGDRRADQGRSIINTPYVYTLSIAVYCTAWTFYGSVGRAAATGLGFLPLYLGPTLMACLWWFVLRKMLRITKAYGITSIADFIASRYGKSVLLGGLVTVIAVVGIMPYISLQLKAVSTSVTVLLGYRAAAGRRAFWRDIALYVALLMAAFSILFGTRHIDATEHHQGMVAAIAFEIGGQAGRVRRGRPVHHLRYVRRPRRHLRARRARPATAICSTFEGAGLSFTDWFAMTCLAGLAILFLPRQFQVAVIENINEDHLNKAIWLLPLYLLAINLFVLPVALGGLLRFPGGEVDGDIFVLTLPMAEQWHLITLLAYLGGLSAATAMVIVATIALSTMLCNDLIMPVLLRLPWLRLNQRPDLSGLLLMIRRGSILAMLLIGLRLLPGGRRILRAGHHGPDLVRRRGAVRAADPDRPVLAGCHARRCADRPVCGLCGLAVHPPAAGAGRVGLARRRLRDRGRVRRRAAAARCPVRPERPRSGQPRADLEPPGQRLRPGRLVADRAPGRLRAHPGLAVRPGRPAAAEVCTGGAAAPRSPISGPCSRATSAPSAPRRRSPATPARAAWR